MDGRLNDNGHAADRRAIDRARRDLVALVGRVLFLLAAAIVLLAIGLGMATAGLYLVLEVYLAAWLAALLTALACATLAVVFLALARWSARRQPRSINTEVAKDVVRGHPLGSAAAALGVGLLLGYVDRSRESLAAPRS